MATDTPAAQPSASTGTLPDAEGAFLLGALGDDEQGPDSLWLGLTTLIDLGSALSGLRELSEQDDLVGLPVGPEHAEAIERVIVAVVQQMGVGAKFAEAAALERLRGGPAGGEAPDQASHHESTARA